MRALTFLYRSDDLLALSFSAILWFNRGQGTLNFYQKVSEQMVIAMALETVRLFTFRLAVVGSIMLSHLLYAEEKQSEGHQEPKFHVELKAGRFSFAESVMRQVYTEGGEEIQLSFTQPVTDLVQLYASLGYMARAGHSLNYRAKTDIETIFANLGLKPTIELFPRLRYYVATGSRLLYVMQRNQSGYVNSNIIKGNIGFFLNTGFNILVQEPYTIDLFAEYSYNKLAFTSATTNVYGRHIQVGGLTFGLGLSYSL